jgi:hypothetical protein
VIDGVGHSPNVEAPDQTAKLILGFAGAAPIEAVAAPPGKQRAKGKKPPSKRNRPGDGR